ncbi:MAG: 2OG-Fe(II) oxygenase [Chitinophagales bacterium]
MTTIKFPRNINEFADQLIDNLAAHSYALQPNFLSQEESNAVLKHIQALQDEDELKKAGIGKQLKFDVRENLRGDFIRWISKSDEPVIVQSFLQRMDFLMQLLNRTCFLSLKDFEAHYTFYPTNTRYIKHRDRFQHNAHRLISVVCYLASDWKVADGGQLIIYNEGEAHEILPAQGTLVCFRSELEHEVLLTNRERYSITGWMLDQPAKLTFL